MTASLAPKRSNFLFSFAFLPRQEREAIQYIYNFCRYTDDLVDEHVAETNVRRARLEEWRRDVQACYEGQVTHPVLRGLRYVLDHFDIPKEYILALIDGVEMDLWKSRYETFEELRSYCFGVASSVGLISVRIFGAKHAETLQYAENLGYALQLTNILRDIKQDASKGRIYLPLQDLRRFGYTEDSLFESQYKEQFIALMRFEVDRAKDYFSIARSFLRKDESHTMFAAQIMDAIYFRLLTKIEQAQYDVFSKRISVSTPHKLFIAAKFWAGSRFGFAS